MLKNNFDDDNERDDDYDYDYFVDTHAFIDK